MKPTEHNAFLNEALETLNRIYQESKHLPQLRWFLETALQRFNKAYLNSRSPRVIVLGDDIPSEILYAVCDDPFYVLGGSLGTAHWADELTPRDTDPFSRSSLGWLLNPEFDLTENVLIVTAVSSDSRRKLISVLQNNGRKVAALDIPPTRSTNAVHYYKEQLTALAETIGKRTGKRFTGANLKRAVKRTDQMRRARHSFLAAALSSGNIISDEAVLLANQCLYFADDLEEWRDHIDLLGEELEKLCKRYALPKKDRPKVMILGSPVVFPNYKVPQLITSAGMDITAIADSLSLGASVAVPKMKTFATADSLLQQIAQTHLKMISSGARVSNEGLYAYFMHLVRQLHPDGIGSFIPTGSSAISSRDRSSTTLNCRASKRRRRNWTFPFSVWKRTISIRIWNS